MVYINFRVLMLARGFTGWKPAK